MFEFLKDHHKDKEHQAKHDDAQSMSDHSNDPLVARVKDALTKQGDSIKGADIFVSKVDGKIILKGVVDNAQERDKALEIARQVDGVKSVSEEFRIMAEEKQPDKNDSPRPGYDLSSDDQGCSPSPRVG